MNNIPDPKEVQTAVALRAEPLRVQALRVVSAIGFALMAISGVDLHGIAQFLPDNVAAWLMVIGTGLAFLKQAVLFIGDFLDNYKIDKSFRLDTLLLFLAIGALVFLNTSCGVRITEDGCILTSYSRGSSTYFVGPCVGPDTDGDGSGNVNRVRVAWQNDAGQKMRATYWTDKSRPVLVEYYVAQDMWLQWTAKSGVIAGPIPPPVVAALQGEPEPVPTPSPASVLAL